MHFCLLWGKNEAVSARKMAALDPRGSQFLINGEPTENKLAVGSKGALRYELKALGKLAHSAYPELGHSAIHSLLDALEDLRTMKLPERSRSLGGDYLNIGTIAGGRAPNVVADEARAEIMFRLVGDPAAIASRGGKDRSPRENRRARGACITPAVHLSALPDFQRRSSPSRPTCRHSMVPGASRF